MCCGNHILATYCVKTPDMSVYAEIRANVGPNMGQMNQNRGHELGELSLLEGKLPNYGELSQIPLYGNMKPAMSYNPDLQSSGNFLDMSDQGIGAADRQIKLEGPTIAYKSGHLGLYFGPVQMPTSEPGQKVSPRGQNLAEFGRSGQIKPETIIRARLPVYNMTEPENLIRHYAKPSDFVPRNELQNHLHHISPLPTGKYSGIEAEVRELGDFYQSHNDLMHKLIADESLEPGYKHTPLEKQKLVLTND